MVSKRYTDMTREERNAYHRAWYHAHIDVARERRRAWRRRRAAKKARLLAQVQSKAVW